MLNAAPETDLNPTRQLTVSRPARVSVLASGAVVVPGIVTDAGEHAALRFLEFFAATVRNRNTRAAYMVAVSRFFTCCEQHRIGRLADIEPLHVAGLRRDARPELREAGSEAASRGDPHAVRLADHRRRARYQSGAPVRGPKHVVKRGKTPVLSAARPAP
jgi:hypothetical protein